ncbi:MAG: 30S ribosomal protein S8 [Gammaproteobacteria bacterium]|nr:30S ribosomal protein S8 [Gammaproteobacteria bacterium]
MTMQDPIADMLTRIRNGQARSKPTVTIPHSKLKEAIAKVLQDSGFITKVDVLEGAKKSLAVTLKYHRGEGVITSIDRKSRPGLRVYRGKDKLPQVMSGLGIAILSTPQGVMTEKQARVKGVGGELLCTVC